jgi:O-antigen/teichoic acid export membrane protein
VSDRAITVLILIAMAAFYLIVPIAVGMSEIETDITASILLAAAISFYTYQDHKDRKPRKYIVRILIWFMLPAMVVMAALLVLVQDFPFVLFIPLNAILVGTIYWYIERSLPSER